MQVRHFQRATKGNKRRQKATRTGHRLATYHRLLTAAGLSSGLASHSSCGINPQERVASRVDGARHTSCAALSFIDVSPAAASTYHAHEVHSLFPLTQGCKGKIVTGIEQCPWPTQPVCHWSKHNQPSNQHAQTSYKSGYAKGRSDDFGYLQVEKASVLYVSAKRRLPYLRQTVQGVPLQRLMRQTQRKLSPEHPQLQG